MPNQDTYNEVILVEIMGTLLLLALSGVVVFVLLFYQKKRFRHRQQLLETHLETQEETFRQISEELHDNVGQLLGTTKNLLWITERSLPDTPDALRAAIDTLATAMRDLRSLSKALNREWLERFNLVENLQAESDRINLGNTVSVTVNATGTSLPLTPKAQIMLFRIIQEALHNGIRHSEATHVGITIGWEGPRLLILIRDNGKGFDPDTAPSNGVGLMNMKHRTRMLDGTISWESVAAGGTTVKICIPLQN